MWGLYLNLHFVVFVKLEIQLKKKESQQQQGVCCKREKCLLSDGGLLLLPSSCYPSRLDYLPAEYTHTAEQTSYYAFTYLVFLDPTIPTSVRDKCAKCRSTFW